MKKKVLHKESEKDIVCKKDDILELDILNMGNDGEGIGKFNGYTLFVKDAMVGDRVRVKVMKAKKQFGYAKLLEVLEPSEDRVEPICPVSGKCGGCQLQHCSYERQLAFKEEKVRNCLERIGGFRVSASGVERILESEDGSGGEPGEGKDSISGVRRQDRSEYGAGKESVSGGGCGNVVRMEPILGMEYPYYYRNKAQYPMGVDKQGNLVVGFYAGRTHQIIPNTDCIIQHPCNHLILETVLAFMREYQIPTYDEAVHTGLVRHVLTRVGVKTGEIMVCLVVNGEKLPHTDRLLERLLALRFEKKGDAADTDIYDRRDGGRTEQMPALRIASVCLNHNTEKTNVILGDRISVLYGQSYIEDFIGDIKFQISPLSFYQVNPRQTEKLYQTALEYAGLTGGETVWDLYCGIGTISLFLAKKAGKVCGVDVIRQIISSRFRQIVWA